MGSPATNAWGIASAIPFSRLGIRSSRNLPDHRSPVADGSSGPEGEVVPLSAHGQPVVSPASRTTPEYAPPGWEIDLPRSRSGCDFHSALRSDPGLQPQLPETDRRSIAP